MPKTFALLVAIVMIGLLFTASAAATNYYIASSGLDSNNGTSKGTPWLHAPGMTGCSGHCSSYSPAPGDRFIFRGGDAWHYSTGAGTPVGIPWVWSWNGSVANPIYLGVDQTWYSGNTWVRPILNGDNPLTTTPVARCSYDQSTTAFVYLNAANVMFDNFEIFGGCWHGTQNGYGLCCLNYIAKGVPSNPANIVIENAYLHGWSHVTFSCASGATSGNCDGAQGISGDSHSTGGQGNQIIGVVVDGSDSDPTSLYAVAWDCYDIHQSVFRYNANSVVCNNMHTFHDNLIEYISESSDGQMHSNGFEFNSEWAGSNTIYNNLVRHITAAVAAWSNPSQVDYQYNNVVYDVIANTWYVDATGGGSQLNFWNNTLVGGQIGCSGGYCVNGGWEGVLKNNLLIGVAIQGRVISNTTTTSWTPGQATTAGYGASNNYAPPNQNCNGVTPCPIGAGSDLSAFCSTVSGLCTDTTNACSYSTTTHSMNCPARTTVNRPIGSPWDTAAYQYQASQRPAPPTGLTAMPD
jgi:hypothetical protein